MDDTIVQIAIKSDNRLVTIANMCDEISQRDNGEIGVDVIVKFHNGSTYTASFFQYDELVKEVKLPHSRYAPNKQKYFWRKNMVVVNDFRSDTIERIVHHLIDEGDFKDAFRKI